MMEQKSLKKNAIVGILNTLINILFPLVILIHTSRALMPEGVGIIQLATSVSSYFDLFASLGIPLYAVRQISMLRESKEEQNKNAMDIFWINIINSIIMFVIYLVFIFILYGTSNSFYIFLIYGFSIFSSALGVEWYFKANEEFTYITLRNLIVKIVSVLLIFVFVNDSSDILYYALIYVGGILGYSLVNLIKFAKITHLEFIKINYLKHIKPAFSVFLMSFATTIYCSIDTIMLGYIENEYSVGIYTAAYRVATTIIAVTTSINAIMLPRLSYYYKNNEIDKIKQILTVCYTLALMISTPIVMGIEIFAEDIILILSGPSFIASITPLRIMAPIILFVTLTNIFGIQVFYSSGHVQKTNLSVFGGALINLILNSILIPIIGYNGAAIGTLVAEFIVLVIQLIIGKKLLVFKKFDLNILKILLSTSIMTCILFLIKKLINIHYVVDLGLYVLIAIVLYFVFLFMMKEKYICESLNNIKNKIKGQKNEKI